MAAITKVFEIKLTGSQEVSKGLGTIKRSMDSMGKTIAITKRELDAMLNAKGDSTQIEGLKRKLDELNKSYQQLKNQRTSTERNARDAAMAEKALADAALRQAQAQKELARAERERIKSQIDQEKELDRQIAAEQKLENQLRRQKQVLDALPGSYNEIRNQLNQLRPFIQSGGMGGTIAFNGQNLNFDQAIAEFKRLSAAEQDFRRQFSRDGLLVGEYTSGIVQAFERLNIDDIIKKNIDGAKQQLQALEQETKELVAAYRQAQQTGSATMQELQQKIHNNVVETERLSKAVNNAEAQLKGVGGVGAQITESIQRGFRNLRNSIAQFAVGYFGFQAALQGIRRAFADTVALDSQTRAMELVSGTTAELAINQQFLADTTERLGIETISTTNAFKSFYTAATKAGLSGDQAREIFQAASEAGANLKLSTEQMNGVLLAFSQVASKGRVQAEELRGQIGERIPGAFSLAAKAMGVTEQELNKMLETGQVASKEFLPKFAKELKNAFGTENQARITGLQASINRLRNEFTQLLTNNQGGLTTTFTAIIESVRILVKMLPALITLLSLYAAGWLYTNRVMIAAKAVLLFQKNILPLLTTLIGGQANALRIYAAVSALASKAMAAFSKVLSNPIFRIFSLLIAGTAVAMKAFADQASSASRALDSKAKAAKLQADALSIANKETQESISKEQVLLKIIKDRSLADQTRLKALDELKKMMGEYGEALTLENVLTQEGIDLIEKYNTKLLEGAKIRAAQAVAKREDEKLRSLLVSQSDIETAIATGGTINTTQLSDEILDAYYKATGRSASKIGKWLGDKIGISFDYSGDDLKVFSSVVKKMIAEQTEMATTAALQAMQAEPAPGETTGPIGRTIAAIEADLKEANAQFETAVIGSRDFIELKEKIAKLEEELKAAQGASDGGRSNRRGSRLTGDQRDLFKDIDAIRDTLLAQQQQLLLTMQISEEEYLKNVFRINTEAANQKLSVIKGVNAEERKIIAELNLYKLNEEQQTNKKLFDLENKRIENSLALAQAEQQAILAMTESDPTVSETEKFRARQQFYDNLLVMQIDFNKRQAELEKKLGIVSEENEKKRQEAISDIVRKSIENDPTGPRARLRDIETEGEIALARIRQEIAAKAAAIIQSNKSYYTQARELEQLRADETERLLAAEVEMLKNQADEALKQYNRREISLKEYLDRVAEYKTKEAALFELTTDKEISATERFIKALKELSDQFAENLLGIKKYAKDAQGEQQRIKDAVASTANSVKSAVQSAYDGIFQAQRDNIERQKQDHLDSLSREEERAKARAKSTAEQETIQRQYDQKRKEADKKAAEQQKRLALKRLTMDFAVALMKTFAQFGFPLGLLPAAGLTAAYAVQRSLVQKQQFYKGGRVKPVALSSGRITTPPNIPTQPGGDNVLATVKVNEVILNEEQQRRLGGAPTFRRIGVPGFADGGRVTAPQLGTRVQAPAFSSSGIYDIQQSVASDRLDRIESMVEVVARSVYAADVKPVVLNPNHVTKAEQRTKRDIQLVEI